MKSFVLGSFLVATTLGGWELWSRDMKTYIPYILGIGLFGFVYAGWEFYRNIPNPADTPASPEAKQFIESMLSSKDWRMGKNQDCIVNEKAKVIVLGSKGRVKTWPDEGADWTFSGRSDVYWILQNYAEARKRLQAMLITKTNAPPTEEVKTLLDSLRVANGWRLGKRNNCLVNEKANLIVNSDGSVTAWHDVGDDAASAYDESDQAWIRMGYEAFRRKISIVSLEAVK